MTLPVFKNIPPCPSPPMPRRVGEFSSGGIVSNKKPIDMGWTLGMIREQYGIEVTNNSPSSFYRAFAGIDLINLLSGAYRFIKRKLIPKKISGFKINDPLEN